MSTLIENFFVEILNFKKQNSIPTFVDPNEREGDDEYYDEEVESDEELEMDE